MYSALKKGKFHRIALVIVYIGPAPFWMPSFLLSCRFNPEITWLLFSDMGRPADCPENVQFIPLDLAGFNRRASETLGLDIRVQQSFVYKIADFKSAYGRIFAKDLQPFDFWGHCDLDIVWGNIGHFVSQDILETFDIVTSRPGRISGHFCLFRNIPEITNTYQWIPRFAQMMQDNTLYAIDETHITDYLHIHNNPNWVVRLKQFVLGKQAVQPRVYWENVLTTSGAHQRTMGEGTNRFWLWKDGRTYDADGMEMMYLHFHKIKQTMTGINFGYGDRPKEFKITHEGIVAP